jgi:hypothetical protein
MKTPPTYITFIRSSETKSNTVTITENYKIETMKLHYISIRPERQETEKRYKVSKVL